MSNVFEGTRFCIHTFGCQMNKHDSERVAGMLEGLGSLPVETIEEADIVVFMTCCVREAADTRLYGQVASMKNIPLRDGTPLDKRYIAVGGCIGQRDGDKLLAALPHLDVVFGTHNLGSLPGLLRRAIEQHGRAAEVIEGGAEFSSALPTVREHDWAAWLPITVGCNNFCSYCIVPYVRGRERSRKPENILAEVKKLVAEGYKEITLLGQNVDSYGSDGSTKTTFAGLLDAVASIEGKFRLRFMTSHPKDFGEDVVEVMEKHRKICRLVHLPVQSGSDAVLKAMNRRYTSGKYLSEIELLKTRLPEAEVTTDIIVGFPGETEADYLATEELVKKADFASAFTFVFSPRSGTKAASMEGQISEDVQKDRIMRLVELVNSLTRKKSEKYVGRTVEILCEDYDEKKGLYLGRDEFGRMGYFGSDRNVVGEFVNVKITRANGISLYGEIAAEKENETKEENGI